MTLWLSKDFVVVGIREKYSHYCSIAEKNIFRSYTTCMIIEDEGYEELSEFLKSSFDVGFLTYTLYDKEKKSLIPKGGPIQ